MVSLGRRPGKIRRSTTADTVYNLLLARGALCGTCLTGLTQSPSSIHIREVCRRLAAAHWVDRRKGVCARCGKRRLVSTALHSPKEEPRPPRSSEGVRRFKMEDGTEVDVFFGRGRPPRVRGGRSRERKERGRKDEG